MMITDWERYEYCLMTARTMLLMAKILKEKDISSWKQYALEGIKNCEMAIYYRNLYEEDELMAA